MGIKEKIVWVGDRRKRVVFAGCMVVMMKE